MRSALVGVVLLLGVEACGGSSGSAVADASVTASCHANVGLTAWTTQTAASGVTVFGTTNAPDGVTVRAIYVGAQAVPLTAFNFRAWSVVLTASDLAALSRNGEASIPVIAFTSAGCQTLTGSAELVVRIDAGANTSSDGGPVRDAASTSDAAADHHGG